MNIAERLAKAAEILGNVGVAPQTKCETGKGMYFTREDAEAAARRYRKRKNLHGAKLHAYLCKLCGWWHMTRQK